MAAKPHGYCPNGVWLCEFRVDLHRPSRPKLGAVGAKQGFDVAHVGVLGEQAFGGLGVVGHVLAVQDEDKIGPHADTVDLLYAGVGKYASNTTNTLLGNMPDGIGRTALEFTSATVAGGVASVVGGGSFKDGAKTAGYEYIFNQMSERFLNNVFSSRYGAQDGLQNIRDLPRALGELTLDAAKQGAEYAETGVAMCGLVNPKCRGVDLGIEMTKAGYNAVTGNSGAVISAGAGEVASRSYDAYLKALKVAPKVGEPVSYIIGKGVEAAVNVKNDSQKKP